MFLNALAATVISETAGFAAIKKWILHGKNKWLLETAVVAVASLLTLPYVWFIFPALVKWNYFWVSESFAVLTEGLLYWIILKWKPAKAWGLSLILNIFSVLVGKIIGLF
jgi:hypothetical protein